MSLLGSSDFVIAEVNVRRGLLFAAHLSRVDSHQRMADASGVSPRFVASFAKSNLRSFDSANRKNAACCAQDDNFIYVANFKLRTLDTLEGALDVRVRVAEGDGAAVRATGGVLGFCQLGQQPIDLCRL